MGKVKSPLCGGGYETRALLKLRSDRIEEKLEKFIALGGCVGMEMGKE